MLELQGNFSLHHRILSNIGINSSSVKLPSDLEGIDGLIIPGGESTTISLLIDSFNLREPIKNFSKSKPIMGTCAGLILMANNVRDRKVAPLSLLDITIERNAYGTQVESTTRMVEFNFNPSLTLELPATLIRAPKITKTSKNINILGEINGSPIAVFSNMYLGLSFHPELNNIDVFHKILFDSESLVYYKNIN